VLTDLTDSLGRIGARHGSKLIRFGAVSAFNVILGQLLLYGAQVVLAWSPVMANTFALCLGAVPAYVLSRYWVWEKRGKNQIMAEVIPFWTLTIIGFILSTGAIWYVDTRWDAAPLVINLTNLLAYGLVWVVKFMVLDRVLFKPTEVPA